jgi:hypothetical protein
MEDRKIPRARWNAEVNQVWEWDGWKMEMGEEC